MALYIILIKFNHMAISLINTDTNEEKSQFFTFKIKNHTTSEDVYLNNFNALQISQDNNTNRAFISAVSSNSPYNNQLSSCLPRFASTGGGSTCQRGIKKSRRDDKVRGRSRISGKGVHMYKGVGFALLILYLFS